MPSENTPSSRPDPERQRLRSRGTCCSARIPALPDSREAAKQCSPLRKPRDTKNMTCPSRGAAKDSSPGLQSWVSRTKWNQVPEGRHDRVPHVSRILRDVANPVPPAMLTTNREGHEFTRAAPAVK